MAIRSYALIVCAAVALALSLTVYQAAPVAAQTTQPVWQTLPLTDVRTAETFTLGGFAGKTVYVEPMATWCTNCRQQAGQVREARAQLDPDQYVFISLSVEDNLPNDVLAGYADQAGFDWTFAVATPELLAELTSSFGRSVTVPPSTPHFIIRPDGAVSGLTTGLESADVLVQKLTGGG